MQPESGFFDPQNPEKNNRVVPFSVREQEMKAIHDLGMKKVYLHLDGWLSRVMTISIRTIPRHVKRPAAGKA